MKLPIRTLGLAIAALLIGSALAPVSAQQQQSGVDGQVAVRASDGALYLIMNGQRRWVATVVATDEEINAIPEGEPLYAGLAPMGSTTSTAATTKPSTQGTTSSKPVSKTTKPTSSSSSSSSSSSKDDDDDDDDDPNLSDDIPITVDIGGDTRIEPGDSRNVEIKTRKDVTCELRVELPDDDPIEEDSKNADSRGVCKYTIEIPNDTKEGDAKVIGTVREGGKMNRQEIDIEIEE